MAMKHPWNKPINPQYPPDWLIVAVVTVLLLTMLAW